MKYLYFLSTLLLAVATTAQKCTDSSDFLISGRCFKLVNKQLSYQDARDWCRYSNPVGFTYLATVADPNTDNFLASYARTTFNSNEGSFWIGLTRASTSSKWQWEDGTPVVWTNFQVQNSQKYAAESITNGKWTGYSPDTKMNFVCSYWPGATPGPTPGVETTAPYNWQTTVSESYPTPTAPDACTRKTNSTILYAYSNDLDAYDVNMLRLDIVTTNMYHFYGYTTFANVRFDVKNEEEIQYHSDVYSFNASVDARMPNPSLSYGESATGSNVFNVLTNFLDNDQATICGSIVYIVAKRYPNQVDLTDLISQLRANHVFVYVVAHNVPSGGNNPHALFEVASKTNGFCVFNSGPNFWLSVDNLSYVNYRPYQFYSQNYAVTGSGRLTLPSFTPNPTKYEEQMLVVITVQDHKIDNTFVSLNYTIESIDGSWTWTGPDIGSGYPRFGTGILAQPFLNGSVYYKMTIDYHYATDQQQVIETRLHSNYYHDFIPFANSF